MSWVGSEGTRAQSLKWRLFAVMSFADLFRSADRTGTQKPAAFWNTTARRSVGVLMRSVLNVIATGVLKLVPPASSRYAPPTPCGAVLVISWMENCVEVDTAPAGTWTVSRPSGVAIVPPFGPMEPVIGDTPGTGDPGETGAGRSMVEVPPPEGPE
jgi:hypothetical protein